MSTPTQMVRAARAVWRSLPELQQDAIQSSRLVQHVDRPHGFDRELLHSWPATVYGALHRRGLIDEPAWPCLLTPAGLMLLDAGSDEEDPS